ncbi:MAG: type II toxin-antitoxin system HicA family toxin [Chloroflexota bacterium]|nr:type II toxin-antitoxin system HicA family toxin [Chloroflexota bacterium]
MRHRELTRKLRNLGCGLYRQGKGSHEVWRNTNGDETTIPNWGSKDLPIGTIRKILRDLGITREAFNEA